MKLTIDTKHDSHEEIKHAIDILHQVLTRKGGSIQPVPEVSPETATNMMSMFADTPETSSPTAETQTAEETAPDFSSFLNLTNDEQKEEPKEDPKVEYF